MSIAAQPVQSTGFQQEYSSFIESEKKVEPMLQSTLVYITGFIIVCEFCERLAYYGLASSLVLYMQKELSMSNSAADVQYALWSGMCYVTPLIGGYVADSYLGRYNTIMFFSSVYLVGLVLTSFAAAPVTTTLFESAPSLFLFSGIYIIALGTGGIKPNVSTFGADQFDDNSPKDQKEKASFFNWFYWSINLGALLSFTIVSYVCQYGIDGLGGKKWGFSVGFAIPCIAMFLAICVFKAGTKRYKISQCEGSGAMKKTAVIIKDALIKSFNTSRMSILISRQDDIQEDGQKMFRSSGSSSSLTHHGVYSSLLASRECLLPERCYEIDNVQSCNGLELNRFDGHWLERVSISKGGVHADEDVLAVKTIWKLLPLLIIQVPFWAVYSQMSTAFQNQGCQMNLSLGPSLAIPISALNIFDTLSILILVPVFDLFIYPMILSISNKMHAYSEKRLIDEFGDYYASNRVKPESIDVLKKIGWGFVFACAAVGCAGAVEIYRKQMVHEYSSIDDNLSSCFSGSLDDYSYTQFQLFFKTKNPDDMPMFCRKIDECDILDANTLLDKSCIYCDNIPTASNLSILWQIPQFMLIGTSEILASISAMEFFYSEAPENMRSIASSLNLLCTGLGSWVTIPLIKIVNMGPADKKWIPDDLNQGYLELYFFLLAGIMILTLIVYILWAKKYRKHQSPSASCHEL